MAKPKNEWADVAAELAKDTNQGLVVYLKPGETIVKFCVPVGAPAKSFYTKLDDIDMNGLARTAYLVSAVIVEVNDEETKDETVKYLKVTKTVMDKIVADLSKGWELLDPNGEQFAIKKLSKKPWYEAGVIRSKYDSSKAVFPEVTLTQAAQEEAAAVLSRSQGKGKSKVQDDEPPF